MAARWPPAEWPAEAPDLPQDLLAGGCSVSGVYDLEPVRLSYHSEILDIPAAKSPRWSPLHCLPAMAPGLILAVGSEETREFLHQHRDYAAAWSGRGLDLREVPLPGLHHFSAVDALGQPGHPLCAAVQQMLQGRLS